MKNVQKGRKKRRRSKNSWYDSIKEDLRSMGIVNEKYEGMEEINPIDRGTPHSSVYFAYTEI